jgi:hypothetical protein
VRRLRLHYFIGMALTILVAGIGKDERARVEGAVKAALGWRGLTETWSVSLVKVGSQWSVTLSGPGEAFRNLSFGATEQELCEKITAAIGGVDAPPAGAPEPAPPVSSPYSAPSYPPAPYESAPAAPYAAGPYAPVPKAPVPQAPAPYEPDPYAAAPAASAPYPPASVAPAPYAPVPATPVPRAPVPRAPIPAATTPRAPAQVAQHRAPAPVHPANQDDCWTCMDCGGAFRVLYEHHPGEAMVMAAVACPHCWKLNHIEIGSWAAEGRDYRAEKA